MIIYVEKIVVILFSYENTDIKLFIFNIETLACWDSLTHVVPVEF